MNNIDRIREALQFIPIGGHDERFRIGCMVKSELGDAGRDLWDEWRDGRGDDEAASVWKSISENGALKIGTLFHEAKANGWRDDGRYQKPTPEELAERRRIATERAAKEEAEIARERADTAKKAAAILKAATEAKVDNPYLVRKRVFPVATLREIDAGAAATILGYAPQCRGDLLTGRLLVVPVKQGDGISTLELIDGDKRKAALAGRGSKVSGYWATERLPDGDGVGLTLLIGEGVATVLSAAEATGHPAIAALSSGNLSSVAKAMRELYPAAALVILTDLVKATGEPDPHAVEAARSAGGMLAIPDFGSVRAPDMKDMNDLGILEGLEAVARAIANARAPAIDDHQPSNDDALVRESEIRASSESFPPTDAQSIDRLAQLSPFDYDRLREAEAKRMGVRAATLDKMVKAARQEMAETDSIDWDEAEPWPQSVSGNDLLTDLAFTVRRFIVCPDETSTAAALWIVMSWFMEVVQVAPLAVITAPEKRCGKSQLLSLLGRLVHRPLTASNITPAALFRSIDAWRPTLLVDEADAFMKDNEELRGLLNCGHTRDSAYIVRVVGDDHTPKRFNVWGAKALAGIGHLADTIMDRAVVLELRRKLPHEEVIRLRYAEPGLFDDLTSKLARFALDNQDALRQCRPALPPQLNDRAQDNWEPLLAIADLAGERWPERARHAALKLSGAGEEGGSVGNELLADIREVFELKKLSKISTADLIAALCDDDEKSWSTYNRGKPINPRQVAKRLREYGIASKTVRIGYNTAKGFELEQFVEAFARYLASSPSASVTRSQPSVDGGAHVTDLSERYGNEEKSVTPNSLCHLGCDVVTDIGREGRGVDVVEVEI